MTVAEMQDRMGIGELRRWAAFEAVEPFLPFRVEAGAGMVAATIANVNRGKNDQPFDVVTFMPFWRAQRERAADEALAQAEFGASEDEEEALLKRLVVRAGGRAG